MIRLVISLTLIFISCNLGAQSDNIDSMKQMLARNLSDSARAGLCAQLADSLIEYRQYDSSSFYADKAIQIARKAGLKKVEGRALLSKSLYYLFQKGNYTSCLSGYLSALQIFENEKDTLGRLDTYFLLLLFYKVIEDYPSSIYYCKKMYSLSKSAGHTYFTWYACHNIGDAYFYLDNPDSCSAYFNEAFQLSNIYKSGNDPMVKGWAFVGLGRSFYLSNDYSLSRSNLDKGLTYAGNISQANIRAAMLADVYETIADLNIQRQQFDSAIKYSHLSIDAANVIDETYQKIIAYKQLANVFERKDKDSSIKYFKLGYAIKDSILNSRSRAELASVTQNELDRQRQVAELEHRMLENRKRNIQYTGIAVALVTCIILFLLYSQSIIGHEKLIKYLGLVVLLILFEFVNLFIHPYIAHVTGESPLLMLLIMVVIAAILVPLHHSIENRVKHQLVEKNKRIRLAAAKRTIASLEGN
jgi:hypothetical protein